MDICEILIVEDHAQTRSSWDRDIREFNRSPSRPFTFRPSYVATKDAAIEALARTKIHCAVVDLRLPQSVEGELASNPLGNDVISMLIDHSAIPVVVYSGYSAEASDAVKGSHIKVVNKKGGASRTILKGFGEQAGLMFAMERTRLIIDKEISRLFNQSIWPRWERKWSGSIDKNIVNGIIARQTVSHIAELLANSPETHHPEEFYIVPALHADRLDTGDILEFRHGYYVVLTPRCNMANNKQPRNLLLVSMTGVPDWSKWKVDLNGTSISKRDRAAERIRSHATQGHEISTHFLPPLDGQGPWLVRFQEARTLKSSAAERLLKCRIASIAPQFVPNLVQRYSTYLGRIGQPDLGAVELAKLCMT